MDAGNDGEGLVTIDFEPDPGCDLDPLTPETPRAELEPVIPAAPITAAPRFTG